MRVKYLVQDTALSEWNRTVMFAYQFPSIADVVCFSAGVTQAIHVPG